MLMKSKILAKNQKMYFSILGGAAQISLVSGLILDQFKRPGTDFLEGALIGFSLVGNLFTLIWISKERSV